jgi:hypothetical protein
VLDLPRLDGDDVSEQVVGEFARNLRKVLEELATADRTLLDHIETKVAKLLDRQRSGTSFRLDVATRSRAIDGAVDMLPAVQRFVALAAALDPQDDAARGEWLSGIGTAVVGKPPAHWADRDVLLFESGVVDLCRSFLATEQLVLESRGYATESMHMYRVSVLDSSGKEWSRVAVLPHAELSRIQSFREAVMGLAEEHGLCSNEHLFGAIASLAGALPTDQNRKTEESA